MSLHKFGIYLFAWKSSIAYFYSAVYSLSFGTFCPKGIKSAPCLKTRNLHNMHKRLYRKSDYPEYIKESQ